MDDGLRVGVSGRYFRKAFHALAFGVEAMSDPATKEEVAAFGLEIAATKTSDFALGGGAGPAAAVGATIEVVRN
jgi:hypothetical protein